MFNYWLKCFSSREYCTSSQEHGQAQQIFNLFWAWGGRNFSLETLLWQCPSLLGWVWVWPEEGAASCPHGWNRLCLANTWRIFRKGRGAEKKAHILISSVGHCCHWFHGMTTYPGGTSWPKSTGRVVYHPLLLCSFKYPGPVLMGQPNHTEKIHHIFPHKF